MFIPLFTITITETVVSWLVFLTWFLLIVQSLQTFWFQARSSNYAQNLAGHTNTRHQQSKFELVYYFTVLTIPASLALYIYAFWSVWPSK